MMAEGINKLSEEQIFESLKELNVPVRMPDLKTPTREFIVRVFECFINDLKIDITSPELITWEASSHIEDGDIYEEAQILLMLSLSVNYITSPLGLDITIKDITEPKPKRTKKILNYILVFWNYYIQKYARFSAIEESFENDKKRAKDIMQENESLDEKYNERLNVLNNMQPSKEELASICNAKQEKAAKLKAECETLQSEYQNLKDKEINIKKETSAVDLNIIKAEERLAELSQLILSSPKQKQINAEIQALKDKIRAKDAEAKEFEEKYRDKMRELQLLEEVKKEQQKVLNSLSEIEEIHKLISETIKSINDVHQKVNEEEDKVKRLQVDLENKKDWKVQQEQKSAKLLLSKKKQLEILQEVLRANQNEEQTEKKDVEALKSTIVNVQNSIDIEDDRILSVIQKCKEVDAIAKERKTFFEMKMKEESNKFMLDIADILKELSRTFTYSDGR